MKAPATVILFAFVAIIVCAFIFLDSVNFLNWFWIASVSVVSMILGFFIGLWTGWRLRVDVTKTRVDTLIMNKGLRR